MGPRKGSQLKEEEDQEEERNQEKNGIDRKHVAPHGIDPFGFQKVRHRNEGDTPLYNAGPEDENEKERSVGRIRDTPFGRFRIFVHQLLVNDRVVTHCGHFQADNRRCQKGKDNDQGHPIQSRSPVCVQYLQQ